MRLPRSSGEICSRSSGLSTGSTRRISFTKYAKGHTAQPSSLVAEVIAARRRGDGQPVQVAVEARELARCAAPRRDAAPATRTGSVWASSSIRLPTDAAEDRTAGRASGTPVRSPESRPGAARRRTRPRARPSDRPAVRRSSATIRRPPSALAISVTQRDGTCSLLRRRSPRGTHSRWRAAPASVASSSWCWRSVSSARSRSSPVAAWRSSSGRSESSRTGAGNEPSTRPRRITRSRSSPTPMRTDPTRTPSPMRPTAPQVGLELELQRPCEDVEGHRALHVGQAGETVESTLHPLEGLLLDEGPPGALSLRAQELVEASAGPGCVLGPALGRGGAAPGRRSGPARSHAAPGCAPLPRACARLATPGRRDRPPRARPPRRRTRQRPRAARPNRDDRRPRPPHVRVAPRPSRERSGPDGGTARRREPGEDVGTAEPRCGKGQEPEERAAGCARRERDRPRPRCARYPPRRAARAPTVRTVRRDPYTIAMRSSGVPSRTASITARTAARTSSSASEVVTMRVCSPDTTASGSASCGRGDVGAQPAHRDEDLGVGLGRRPSRRRAP